MKTLLEKLPRISYINKGIETYCRFEKRRILRKELLKESKAIKTDSMEILAEFENLGNGYLTF